MRAISLLCIFSFMNDSSHGAHIRSLVPSFEFLSRIFTLCRRHHGREYIMQSLIYRPGWSLQLRNEGTSLREGTNGRHRCLFHRLFEYLSLRGNTSEFKRGVRKCCQSVARPRLTIPRIYEIILRFLLRRYLHCRYLYIYIYISVYLTTCIPTLCRLLTYWLISFYTPKYLTSSRHTSNTYSVLIDFFWSSNSLQSWLIFNAFSDDTMIFARFESPVSNLGQHWRRKVYWNFIVRISSRCASMDANLFGVFAIQNVHRNIRVIATWFYAMRERHRQTERKRERVLIFLLHYI